MSRVAVMASAMGRSRVLRLGQVVRCEFRLQQVRCASGRNYYVSEGSIPSGISEEVKDLIRNQRNADNISEWRRGYGIQEPVVMSIRNPDDIDDDTTPEVAYWPHKGETMDPNYKPSPVLLVKKLRPLSGQPYYHKEMCERLGLGEHAPLEKVAVVPNVPSMCVKLFTIKHLIEIIPLKFPMGFPADDEFDPAACRINHKGEFYYHPKLKVDTEARRPTVQMAVTEKQVEQVVRKDWLTPHSTPLGNSNYHRNTKYINPEKLDHATDPKTKVKFS